MEAAGELCVRFLSAEAPPDFVAFHLCAALHAIPKPAGGVRPIACGSMLRRIAAKAVTRAFGDELRKAAGPLQYAIGRPGGLEVLFKALEAQAELYPDACFVKLDFRNAFNSVERAAVLQALRLQCPELLRVGATLLPMETTHPWYGDTDVCRVKSERGADQGCPLSPAMFSMAIAPLLDSLLGTVRARDEHAWVGSYLDDIYLVLPKGDIHAAVAAARALFGAAGLHLQPGKTRVWTPRAETDVPGTFRLGEEEPARDALPRVRSLPCLGGTLPYVRAAEHLDEVSLGDLEGPAAAALAAIDTLTACLTELRQVGLRLHEALLLHKTFADGAVTHFLRLASMPDAWCEEWDLRVRRLWETEVTRRPFTEAERALLFTPLSSGGMGLQSASKRRHAAFLASWELCLQQTGAALGCPSAHAFRAALPTCTARIEQAAAALSASFPGEETYAFDWGSLFADAAQGRQAELMEDAHRGAFSALLSSLSETDQGRVRSGGGSGAGAFFQLPARGAACPLADTFLRVALRDRLLAPHAAHDPHPAGPPAPSTQCQKIYGPGSDNRGQYCGKDLDADGRHARTCNVGGDVDAGHDSIADWLALLINRWTGQRALREQVVPAWNRPKKVRGEIVTEVVDGVRVPKMELARLDVSFYATDGHYTHVDVTVPTVETVQVAKRRQRAHADGAAAADAEADKHRRYRAASNPTEPLVAFAVEARGRLGREARQLLQALAPAGPSRGAELHRAYSELSTLVQLRSATLLLAAEGGGVAAARGRR